MFTTPGRHYLFTGDKQLCVFEVLLVGGGACGYDHSNGGSSGYVASGVFSYEEIGNAPFVNVGRGCVSSSSAAKDSELYNTERGDVLLLTGKRAVSNGNGASGGGGSAGLVAGDCEPRDGGSNGSDGIGPNAGKGSGSFLNKVNIDIGTSVTAGAGGKGGASAPTRPNICGGGGGAGGILINGIGPTAANGKTYDEVYGPFAGNGGIGFGAGGGANSGTGTDAAGDGADGVVYIRWRSAD